MLNTILLILWLTQLVCGICGYILVCKAEKHASDAIEYANKAMEHAHKTLEYWQEFQNLLDEIENKGAKERRQLER